MPGKTVDDLVVTPGGYRHTSHVHAIGPGHRLDLARGTIQQMDARGHLVHDFGPLQIKSGGKPLMPGNVSRHPTLAAGLGEGWIAYAGWTNDTGHPVTLFSTMWKVPPAPKTNHNQVIFLFSGIQNSTNIYQPVLQWGPSAAGGGPYWAVASWYVDGQQGPAFHTNLVQVEPGTVLTGVMTLSGQNNNLFSYDCVFKGIADTSLPVSNIQQLTWNIETLEAYGLQQCSDYPDISSVAFYAIDLQTSAGRPVLSWTPENAITDCKQHVDIVSNANPDGEVDIYF